LGAGYIRERPPLHVLRSLGASILGEGEKNDTHQLANRSADRLAPPPNAGQGPIRMAELGTLGGQSSTANAINDRGEIVGAASPARTTHTPSFGGMGG
jgi:hypothetical protein